MADRSSSDGPSSTSSPQTHFVVYDPRHSARDRFLERSKALSHAARNYHNRRRRNSSRWQPFHPEPRAQPVAKRCGCVEDCKCEDNRQKIEGKCKRFLLMPKNGTGDPFSGLPIMITAEVHETIVFWTKPALWDCVHNYSHGKSNKSYFRLEMEHDILNLQHELDAIMFLYQAAALMSAVHRSDQVERRKLRLKRQALQVLRETVEFSETDPDQNSYINALICATMAALCEGNELEARMHSAQVKLLVKALESQKDSGRIEALTHKLGRVYFFDVLFALTRARACIFQVEHLPSHIQLIIQTQTEWVNKMRASVTGKISFKAPLSQAITDLFSGWRVDIALYGGPAVGSEEFNEMAAYFYVSATSHRLYDKTLSLMQQRQAQAREPGLSEVEAVTRNTEAMLAACLLIQISILQHIIEPVGEVAHANGVVYILKTLLEPIVCADEDERDDLPLVLQEAQLWSLYAAACWEITYLHTTTSKWVPWFVEALRQKANSMHIRTWKEADAIFEQYWPSQLMAPNGAEWFEDLMLSGSVQQGIRGSHKNCCWQAACTLKPRVERRRVVEVM